MCQDKPIINPSLALFLGVFGASLSSIFVRFSQAPALALATYRLLWTVLLMTPYMLLKHLPELKKTGLRDIGMCAISGAFLAGHFTTWFVSLKLTSIASSTALLSTEVIFTALGFTLFLKGKLAKKEILCIVFAFLGSIIVAVSDYGKGVEHALGGDAFAVAAALFVSGYTLIGRMERARLSTWVYTYFTYISCAVTLLILDIITGTPLTGWAIKDVGVAFLLAVFCTLLGHSIFSWCLKYLDPAYVTAMKLCEPVFASLLAIVIFIEIPSWMQLFGVIAILLSVFVYTKLQISKNQR